VKAIGKGIGYDLEAIHFELEFNSPVEEGDSGADVTTRDEWTDEETKDILESRQGERDRDSNVSSIVVNKTALGGDIHGEAIEEESPHVESYDDYLQSVLRDASIAAEHGIRDLQEWAHTQYYSADAEAEACALLSKYPNIDSPYRTKKTKPTEIPGNVRPRCTSRSEEPSPWEQGSGQIYEAISAMYHQASESTSGDAVIRGAAVVSKRLVTDSVTREDELDNFASAPTYTSSNDTYMLCEDWIFQIFSLDDRHVMTIALGPLTEAIPSFAEAAWSHLPPPPSLDRGAMHACLRRHTESLAGAMPHPQRLSPSALRDMTANRR
jgi:hypothetical protein